MNRQVLDLKVIHNLDINIEMLDNLSWSKKHFMDVETIFLLDNILICDLSADKKLLFFLFFQIYAYIVVFSPGPRVIGRTKLVNWFLI